MTASKRLLSLDVLRGFDMLFIMGLAHHDTILPLFLFIAGATWPKKCRKFTPPASGIFRSHPGKQIRGRARDGFAGGSIIFHREGSGCPGGTATGLAQTLRRIWRGPSMERQWSASKPEGCL